MQRMFVSLVALVVVAGLLLAGGYRATVIQARRQTNKVEAQAAYGECVSRYLKYHSYEQYHVNLIVPRVSAVSQEEWAKRFAKLRVAMNEMDVEQVMGAPDYARCYMTKGGFGFIGSSWNYQVAIHEDTLNYKRNSWIQIFFDAGGKLSGKDAVNIQGIPNRIRLPQASLSGRERITKGQKPRARS